MWISCRTCKDSGLEKLWHIAQANHHRIHPTSLRVCHHWRCRFAGSNLAHIRHELIFVSSKVWPSIAWNAWSSTPRNYHRNGASIAMNPAAPKVHSFFFTRKSVGVSQSWATAGTPYSIHISSTFHPDFIHSPCIFLQFSRKWADFHWRDEIWRTNQLILPYPMHILSESLLPPQEAPRLRPLRPPQGWPSRGILEAPQFFHASWMVHPIIIW